MPLPSNMVTITGTALDITGANPVSYIDIQLTNYAPSVPVVLTLGVLFQTSVKVVPSATGGWTVNLFLNNQIDPGHGGSPVQTYYQFDFKDEQRNNIVTLFYQFLSTGSFDITTQSPYIVGS